MLATTGQQHWPARETSGMGSDLSGGKGPQSFGDRIMLVVVLEITVLLLAQLYVCRAEVVVK